MATLSSLKRALRRAVEEIAPSPKQALSDALYSTGFDTLVRGSGWTTYEEFIIPQLSELMAELFDSRAYISALEIGPGPKSILGHLPDLMRRKVKRYTVFEPNSLFATKLEEWLLSTSETEPALPCLETPPDIHRVPFAPQNNIRSGIGTGDRDEKFDLILFCHSMYGMKPKHKFIEQALEMLVEQPQGGVVAVFYRDGSLHLDSLVCHRTAFFPTGVIRVANDDDVLDSFTAFIAGFTMQDTGLDKAVRVEWRKVCRALGRREEARPEHLFFSSPDVMVAFDQHASSLPELAVKAPLVKEVQTIKNWEARLHRPASTVRPTEIQHIQHCVRWALEHGVGLTVVGGSHSGHCL